MDNRTALETEPLEKRTLTKREAESQVEDDVVRTNRAILYEIGQEFNKLLKKNSRAQAYQYLQRALMQNMDRLVPSIIPLKDHIVTITELEEYLKGSLGTTGKPPLDALASWLQGEELK